MTKFIIIMVVILIFVGLGFFLGWHMKPEPTMSQPEPIDEATESPAIIETVYVEQPAKIITKQITKTDTVLVKKNVYLPTKAVKAEQIVTAFHPFYFSREGASFQMDITYRYSDQKFRFENMQFNAPKQKVVYRDKIFKLSSGIGYLRGLNGNDCMPLQPINLRVWKLNLKPTIMPYWDNIKNEYGFAYGGMVEFIW